MAEKVLHPKDVVILDGYLFNTSYQDKIKSFGCTLVCIDDLHEYSFVADVVINHTSGVSPDCYSIEPYTQLYLGSAYALLRPPFLLPRFDKHNKTSLSKLFLNMGGADPENNTCKILKHLQLQPALQKIKVVTGSGFRHLKALDCLIKTDTKIEHHHAVDAVTMVAIMKICGVAICPPSSVSFEYASTGGLLFQYIIADNQKHVQEYFLSKGLSYDYNSSFEDILHRIR